MDGVHTQGLHSGQQDGGQDNDGGAGIHDHAQDQEQDDQDRQDAPGSGEVAHNEVLDHLGGAGQGQHAAESGGKSQHESQAAVSLDRAGQEGDQVLQRDGAVHHQGDEQSVEHGHAGRLSGGDDAGVDAAQHDDGAQQGEEAVSKQLQEAVAPQLGHLGADALLVLALGDAENHRIGHHEQADQDAGDDAGQEQVAGGNAGGQGVEHEGDGGRNDDAQAAGHGDQAGAPALLIAHFHHEGDAHGADGGGGGRAGTGDGAVEQAGQDGRAGHTAGDVSYEVGEEVEQPA